MAEFRMLDLFSGLGGASAAMRARGWRVVRVDNNPDFHPDICTDLLTWHPDFDQGYFDLIWASPPCTEFSRYLQPGIFPDQGLPSMDLYNASRRIIQLLQPRYYVIENVRGAVKFFSPGFHSYGPFYLWGNVPELPIRSSRYDYQKGCVTSGHKNRAAQRAVIPEKLSRALMFFVEYQAQLPLFDRLEIFYSMGV